MASVIQTKATPVYNWNASNRTYSTGRSALTQAEVRGYVDAAISQARNEARVIAEAYLKHRNSAEFETAMKALLKNEHLSLSMIANGGRDQMTPKLWGRAGAVIKDQYAYLENFGRQIDRGEVSDAALLARAESYANFGGQLYENFVRDGMVDAGMSEALNTIGGSVHSCSDCPSLSAAGWIPIADMTPVGERACSVGCNCSVSYR